MNKDHCEFTTGCPMFKLFCLDSCKKLFKTLYCDHANHTKCMRYKLRTTGKEVPQNLLPNGKMLEIPVKY